jgi:hypothetical protein
MHFNRLVVIPSLLYHRPHSALPWRNFGSCSMIMSNTTVHHTYTYCNNNNNNINININKIMDRTVSSRSFSHCYPIFNALDMEKNSNVVENELLPEEQEQGNNSVTVELDTNPYYVTSGYESKYKGVQLNVSAPEDKVVLTIESVGPANTETLWKAVQERFPEAFVSKAKFKAALKRLKRDRRIDAKRNPLDSIVKKPGYQYHLTLKERKCLLKKRKEALKLQQQASQMSTPDIVEEQRQQESTA